MVYLEKNGVEIFEMETEREGFVNISNLVQKLLEFTFKSLKGIVKHVKSFELIDLESCLFAKKGKLIFLIEARQSVLLTFTICDNNSWNLHLNH